MTCIDLPISLGELINSHERLLGVNGDNLRITIPAGIENGQTIKNFRTRQKWKQWQSKQRFVFDFYNCLNPRIRHVDKNLLSELGIDIYTAILGGEMIFDTLSNNVKIKINAETHNSTKIRLQTKEIPAFKN